MRICFFTPAFLPAVGGTEYITDALARQFHAKGHHVVVLTRGKPRDLGLPYPVRWYSKPFLPRIFPERIGRRLAQVHAEERFDLFLCNYGAPTGYAALKLGAKVNVPTVVISHGGDLYRSAPRRQRPHLWKRTVYAYQNAQGLIAISPYIETLIREINPAPKLIERIPNGINTEEVTAPARRPKDFTDERPYCLCLGNLGPLKGFADAVEAYAKVHRQLGGLIMLIVGSGKEEANLRQRVAQHNLGDRVLFLGKRTGEDKRWLLQNARFGVAPSLEEGHPIVGLEFLAAGKPVVCSLNESFDEMFFEGKNAWRVPAERPDDLAAAILRMSQSNLAVMGEFSSGKAKEFDASHIADRYLTLMQRVIEEWRSASDRSRPA